MANYDFNKDIIEGESGEIIVLRDLETLGCKLISTNKDNKYDLLVGKKNKTITYEVKTDVFCKPHTDTGNLFIEFECRGKPSGIKVTQAKWFVTYYKHLNEIWYIKSEDLIRLCDNEDFKVTEFSGDANSNTKGYLIPRYKFKKHFIVRLIPKEWLN